MPACAHGGIASDDPYRTVAVREGSFTVRSPTRGLGREGGSLGAGVAQHLLVASNRAPHTQSVMGPCAGSNSLPLRRAGGPGDAQR